MNDNFQNLCKRTKVMTVKIRDDFGRDAQSVCKVTCFYDEFFRISGTYAVRWPKISE